LQRSVGPEGFVGDGLDVVEAAREQLLGFRLVGVLREEPLAFAGSPDLREPVVAQKNLWRIGITGTLQE